jgi:lysophospholipid acyltransferase (LPLAT)-like uncharacterized protein
MKHVLRHPAVQAVLAWMGGLYLFFALSTTRWRLDGAEYALPHPSRRPLVVAFWHEFLPLMPMLWRFRLRMTPGRNRGLSAHVLVSQHRDGRFIGAVMRWFRLGVVLGSSRRGGASGVRAMLELLAAGNYVAITPDGPRGPRRAAAPGVAQIAALSGIPILPCAAQTSRRRILRTWDHMVAPLPFGRGVVVCLKPIDVPRDGWETCIPMIEAAMTAAATRAEQLCPQ